MKCIFQDVDGPLATDRKGWDKEQTTEGNIYLFDPLCVEQLNRVLIETGADIVLSSDWKYHFSLGAMRRIFALNGIIKSPICFTTLNAVGRKLSMDLEGVRKLEIKQWIEEHKPKNHVAVDDLDLTDPEINFLQVDSYNGIDEHIANGMINILNK